MTSNQPTWYAADLRARLAMDLADVGHLRSKEWRAAVEEVPREEFIPEFFAKIDRMDGPTLWDPISAERSGAERWLRLAYDDLSHVTQLNGQITPADVADPVDGNPTSSSTMPSLVVRMWEDLEVVDGNRVLEVGTGTGYSTALGCHRLGESNLTSVEVDPEVAERARRALARAGYHPRLIVGDGEEGSFDGTPYDRIIATCSFRYVPRAWLQQSKPGTIILVTLSGWLGGTGLVKLTVTGDETAEGQFLPGYVGFMPARAHSPEPVVIPDLSEGADLRETELGPDVLTTYGPGQLVAQLAVPEAQHISFGPGSDFPEHLLVQADDSYAAFIGVPGGWTIEQGGPQRLWDQVESAVASWRASGEVDIQAFRVTVAPDEQRVHIPGGQSWRLPLR
ncbi:methyltransferase of ATP-grasp peptide maturase system [Kribbella sp. VKM Ac-2571]|uniref:ATP-grasp peptide maturase system methyltransferase n=1 Tax=Kribbella sp. VKM Ac-2571 TaxID=2512222 RepID=UPI0010E07391|nr:ATP-grasp peptide maturase system methyltransferase [Kribbella sp. VKM Ac-2571]TDO67220.1 methyltransferase of ATP-grasp peptide maturase system [Kribbella sp. VKM Ac-2571]